MVVVQAVVVAGQRGLSSILTGASLPSVDVAAETAQHPPEESSCAVVVAASSTSASRLSSSPSNKGGEKVADLYGEASYPLSSRSAPSCHARIMHQSHGILYCRAEAGGEY